MICFLTNQISIDNTTVMNQNNGVHKFWVYIENFWPDSDETLVHFFGNENNWKYVEDYDNTFVKPRILDIVVENEFMWGIARPHVSEFLDAAFETFDVVGVWSAGVEDYVQEIVKKIFKKKPYFVWSRKMCEMMVTDTDTVRQKPLSKLYTAFPEIDPNRTLIVDDRSEVCAQDILSHIDVAIWDATFDDLDRNDNILACLITFMRQKVDGSDNFKLLSTKNIFSVDCYEHYVLAYQRKSKKIVTKIMPVSKSSRKINKTTKIPV